jgi:hypothetical protein
MEHDCSLPRSKQSVICPCPQPGDSVYDLLSYFFKTYFNIILPAVFSSNHSSRHLHKFLFSPSCDMPRPVIHHNSITLVIFGEQYRSLHSAASSSALLLRPSKSLISSSVPSIHIWYYSFCATFWKSHSPIKGQRILQIAVFCLLGDSPAPEIYVPTFRNTLSHLHRSCSKKMEQTTGESSKRKNITSRTQRKYEIKKDYILYIGCTNCYMLQCRGAL